MIEFSLRREYLAALGIQGWAPRAVSPPDFQKPAASVVGGAVQDSPIPVQQVTPESPLVAPSPVAVSATPQPDRPPSVTPARPAPRGAEASPELPPWLMEQIPDDDDFEPIDRNEGNVDFDLPLRPRIPPVETLDWEGLQERVAGCTGCELHRTRTKTVFGVGDRQARLLVIGEAPGADEDRQGEPFVGRAGQLLTIMLRAVGLRRDQVYIANILKCRPPGNREPHIDEATRCSPYLRRQIDLIAPKVILAVGRIAAQNLLGSDLAVGKMRGGEHRFGETQIPLVVSYHPAYLLRTPEQKGAAWQDWQRAARLLRTP